MSPADSDSDPDQMWLDENVWTPPFRLPITGVQVLTPQSPPPEFIPGRGFATYLASQATSSMLPSSSNSMLVRAPSCIPFQCPRLCPRSPSLEGPNTCSLLLMVLRVKEFQSYFPDYLAKLTLEEFGKPPYPRYLQTLLTAEFLCLLTEFKSISILPVRAQETPVHTSAPMSEPEQSSVDIEWDDSQPLIELVHPPSESAPLVLASLPIVADLMLAPCAASRLAPTENEHRLAPTDGLNEQNIVHRPIAEPSLIARYRLVPFCPPECLEDAPLLTESVPQTALITDNHSPLYNANGYSLSYVTATSARLKFSLTPEPHFRSHRNAHLTQCLDTEGIPMRIPLNTIFELGDLLMLWTCYEVDYNHPLVTSFMVHDAASFRLRIVISVCYEAGHLTLLSEPLPDTED